MAVLLRYRLDTGAIEGSWESTDLGMLQAQAVAGDPVYGYILSTLDLPVSVLEEDYLVIEGDVVPKPVAREDR